MSKYDPLKARLLAAKGEEIPMRFEEVEAVLGFVLPPSARKHAAWWSNNVGTHVGARAWREAGWKTSRVDLGSEKVVFVREEGASFHPPAPAQPRRLADLLSPAAAQLLEAKRRSGMDEDAAIAVLLNELAAERRRRLVDGFANRSPVFQGDENVRLLREDRDAR